MLILLFLVIVLTKNTIKSSNNENSFNNDRILPNQNQMQLKSNQTNLTGTCGRTMTYSIEGDKLIIEGKGTMDDFSSSEGPP